MQNEFFAEEHLLTIIPTINHPAFHLISGNFGPLTSGLPCIVPIWLAITLRKRSKCSIKCPDWLTTEYLENIVQKERTQLQLEKLPFYYLEIANLLLSNASQDIPNPDSIAALIQDIKNIRMDRIRIGMSNTSDSVKQDNSIILTSLKNVSSYEIFSIRDFFLESLDFFTWLRPPDSEYQNNNIQNSENIQSKKKLRRFRGS